MKKIKFILVLVAMTVCLFMTACQHELSGNTYLVVSVKKYAIDGQRNNIYKCEIKTLKPIHTSINNTFDLYTRELYCVGDTLYIGK